MVNKKIKFPKLLLAEYLLIIFSIIFSSWLMFATFSYEKGSMLIGAKAWSDFASTIPLIRSFSFGTNFPPQYPLFSGEAMHFHFLFYALVGMLEKIGLRIDFALNILSILGFAGLLIIIYFFSKKIFKSTAVGVLSVIFFLLNGSLSFLEFFKAHSLSSNTFNDIILNKVFPSFGPYDGKIVSAFWNLNIYTNQRHLAGAFFVSLLIILVLLSPIYSKIKPKTAVFLILGIIFGFLFFFHLAVFMITAIVMLALGILFKNVRIPVLVVLLVGGTIAFPQYLYLQSGGGQTFKPFLSFGYLVSGNLTFKSFIEYWFLNLGIHTILIPLGFFLAPKNIRKIFLAFFLIFIIGNTIQFSKELAANHKFFNYFMLFGVMLSAFALIKIWNFKSYLKPAVVIILFFLVLSGIIDFFPVYNDYKIALADYPVNPDISWIIKNTKPNSVFLNTRYLYDSASLAGRKIFLGWPYFAWSAGYNTDARFQTMKRMLEVNDRQTACKMLAQENINYVELETPNPLDNVSINYSFFENNFRKIYNSPTSSLSLYDISKSCGTIR